ncbi:signal peptidase II [Methylacidimicrobium tartarophylax]|uniref:Lipoprotein signal peptidase n=1 Tax=Methylacidimicrobium tartarophylax TaxID=1041768 RepID=A0A5E6M6A9_9BACT|nr:signal peptidase II [Methylacidimicrobium tartarophylax]VVM04829.1 signal peptidase II [Methylacidimicrobium tartarophylax]
MTSLLRPNGDGLGSVSSGERKGEPTRRRAPAPFFWGLLLGLFLLDQGTKTLILRFSDHLTLSVIPGLLNLVSVRNTGIVFGLFSGENWLWIGVGAAFLLVGFWIGRRLDWRRRETNVIAALLAAGAAGNLSDRILHGFVVDFIDLYVGPWHWPSFNVADSCLCLASLWIVFRFGLAPGR